MNEKVLKELVKTRNVLKKKFRSMKNGEAETREQLKDRFKPITEPLENFISISKNIKKNSKIEKKNNIKNESKQFKTETGTPIKKPTSISEDYDDDDDDFYSQPETENRNSHMNFSDLLYLEKRDELDTMYGLHKDSNDKWKFGDSYIKFNEDRIQVGNQIWALTPGLFSLMFHKIPKHYDRSELDIYKKILINTNAYKRGYSSDGHIKGTRAYKYKNIIQKLIKPENRTITAAQLSTSSDPTTIGTKENYTGSGIMNFNLNKPNYIYWDNPNELIDRLRLLIASQAAGHSNHNNEIVSIIEELYEANIIEKPFN